MAMNVLFLIWNYWPGIEGGSERQARQVAAELVRRGHSCAVWTAWQESHWPRQDMKDGVTVLRLGTLAPWQNRGRRALDRFHGFVRGWLSHFPPAAQLKHERIRRHLDFWAVLPLVWLTRWSFMRQVRRQAAVLASRPDVVHLHEPSWLGGFAVQLFQKRGIPVLCQEATNPALPVLGYDVPCRSRLERLRKEAHFIAMAPYLAEDLRAKGVAPERIHLLPNGVDIPQETSQPAESRMVLYVGNFSQGSHWKAFDVLFDAWALVHKQDPEARLVLLGGGDRAAWEHYVEKQGCAGAVEFAGRVADPGAYYRRAAIFVLPSRVEGMSNALLEAQAWGLPCVVSDIPGNRAVVQDGKNGWVVPVNDFHALATAILRLLSDVGVRTRIGQAGRLMAEQNLNMATITEALVHIYERLHPNAGKQGD